MQVIEVTGKLFEYDDSVTPSDNAFMKATCSISDSEFKEVVRQFKAVIGHCGLKYRVEFQIEGYYFYVRGWIPDDVMNMFEDILLEYTNDVVDKLDYAIGEID